MTAGEKKMSENERFSKVMKILAKYGIGNSCLSHAAFDDFSESDLDNEEKIQVAIKKIQTYDDRVNSGKNRYPEYIMQCLRRRRRLAEYDVSQDDEICAMDPNEAFEDMCAWNGILGFSNSIKDWVQDIYGVGLE
jgi:hypothetical protein